jgi:hypothetical protein
MLMAHCAAPRSPLQPCRPAVVRGIALDPDLEARRQPCRVLSCQQKKAYASRSFAVMTSAPLSMSASASASADSLLRRKRRTCPARSELAVEQFGAAHGNTAAVLSDGLITGIF